MENYDVDKCSALKWKISLHNVDILRRKLLGDDLVDKQLKRPKDYG